MNSRIYTGKIMHARRSPIQHGWVFPYYFYALDLDELPELNRRIRGFGHNRWQPVSLRDADYLRGAGSLKNQLAEFVDVGGCDRIVLITMARCWRKVFNPVSFYYGLAADGHPCWIVAEVNNTFGERHLYPLSGGDSFPLTCMADKQFHVSPFNNMEGSYRFTFSAPEHHLRIDIQLIRNGEPVLDASMWGAARPLTSRTLWQTIVRQPFTAALTMPRIIWQAAVLHYKKKLPVFSKPAPSSTLTIKEKA